MSRRRKRIERILQRPTRMRFREVVRLLNDFGLRERRTTGSHVFFGKPGVGNIPIPKHGGKWVEHVYLDDVRKLLKLDELDLDALDALLGPELEEEAEDESDDA